MIIDEPIHGRYITMRAVECDDAEFILSLRLDENIKQFISPTENNVEKQKMWIQEQRAREGDYYFLYTDLKGNNIGVISVYNIEDSVGELGRQVGLSDSIANMEAEYLTMCFAFESLKLNKVVGTTYVTNKKIISKARKLGYVLDRIVYVNGIASYYLELTLSEFYAKWKPRMESFLKKVENIQ